jgi:hypothetical protein
MKKMIDEEVERKVQERMNRTEIRRQLNFHEDGDDDYAEVERQEATRYQRRLEHMTQVDQEIQRKNDQKDEMERRKIEDDIKAYMKMKAQQEERAIKEQQEKDAEQRRLKRQWQEDQQRENAKRLKEQEVERLKDEQRRKIDDLTRQLEELENSQSIHEDEITQDQPMTEEEWENERTQDEWEAYEDQQAQLAQDEAKGTSSKDSSFEVVETPLPKAPKIDSRKTSPIKRKVDEEKTPEEIQQTAEALKEAFEAGQISAEQFNEGMKDCSKGVRNYTASLSASYAPFTQTYQSNTLSASYASASLSASYATLARSASYYPEQIYQSNTTKCNCNFCGRAWCISG